MRLRVAPHPASSGLAGDRVSSCLASRPSTLPQLNPRSPRSSFGHASRCVPQGCPRLLHLPAVPATVLQVAPNCVLRRLWRSCLGFPLGIALPVAPLSEVTSRPALFTFRLCLGLESSSCPEFSLPSAPADGSPSCLGSRTFRLCRPCVSRLP
jgi:hypothetical protein